MAENGSWRDQAIPQAMQQHGSTAKPAPRPAPEPTPSSAKE